MKIAVCAVCYDRPDSLRRLLSSLEKAYYDEPVTLIISIDKSDSTAVEELAERYHWPWGELRTVRHDHHMGLRSHILSVGDFLQEFDAVAVLEDDVYVAPSFYHYAKACVEKYHGDPDIAGISLYSYPLDYQCHLPFMPTRSDSDVFLMQSPCSWGQVWMHDQWYAFKNWYDKHSSGFGRLPHMPESVCDWPETSWLKYQVRYCIEERKYFVYPYVSLSTCFCDVGVHATRKLTHTQVGLLEGRKSEFRLDPAVAYDGFFEPESVYDHLRMGEEELCIDFYGEKKNRLHRRYWLTQESAPYKVVRSYALDFKPWEQNVLRDLEGTEIYLYDTEAAGKAPARRSNRADRGFYLYSTYVDFHNVFRRSLLLSLSRIKHKIFG